MQETGIPLNVLRRLPCSPLIAVIVRSAVLIQGRQAALDEAVLVEIDAGCGLCFVRRFEMAKSEARKMPVAGKSGKDGVTANIRVKGEPKQNTPGQFTDKVRIKASKPVK